MANRKQLKVLKEGSRAWNRWRKANPDAKIDLRNADLRGMNLGRVNLMHADLNGANLKGINLAGANLTGADLTGTLLVEAGIDKAKISGSSIPVAEFWGLAGEFEEQNDLVVTRKDRPTITVDNIYTAHHVYEILYQETSMLLPEEYISHMQAAKYVLVLGRFSTPERKALLDALKKELRAQGFLVMALKFDRSINRHFTETIKTLAGFSYFVIADLTNPAPDPLELRATFPDCQIPIVPILREGESLFAKMADLQENSQWALEAIRYDSTGALIKAVKPSIIDPAMNMRRERRLVHALEPQVVLARKLLEKRKR